MERVISPLSIVPVRKEPGDRSEMTTQWLFGETASVQETTEKWARLRFDHDGYEGWVDRLQMQATQTPAPADAVRAAEPVVRVATTHAILQLPMGAVLPADAANAPIPITGRISITGRTTADLEGPAIERITTLAPLWLGAPYLWGGRTPWGVDCSGFTQSLFLLAGVPLQRDAWQQEQQGAPVDLIDLSRTGDLAFFANLEGRIVHVGLVLDAEGGSKRILHASGRVRIDVLDHQGIFNMEQKRYTHSLRSIKRLL